MSTQAAKTAEAVSTPKGNRRGPTGGTRQAGPATQGHEHGVDHGPAHVRAAELSIFKRSVMKSGMGADSFVQALTQTAFASLITWTQVELENLLLAAERLGLDPIGREIFLVRDEDRPKSPAVVVVGVDGWSRIVNTHAEFAGMRFKESDVLVDGVPAWIECSMFRWDRKVPTTVREYFEEVRGESGAWLSHPRRMLRHKAMVQCARLAFGFVGVYDHDEAMRILDARRDHSGVTTQPDAGGAMGSQAVRQVGRVKRAGPLGVAAVREHLGLN